MNKYNENNINRAFSITPTITDDIYMQLPNSLKSICGHFQTGRERDVVLLSSLGVISGLLPKLSGIYDNHKVFSNLYLFVAAPAASFKGSMNWSRKIGGKVHSERLVEYRLNVEHYKSQAKKRTKNKEESEEIEVPKRSMLFLPANSSSAAVMSFLDDNDGCGILFESEADTLSQTLKADWGNYGDMLRKAFHHETTTSTRAENNVYLEISLPKISVILSGTFAQITRLIPNVEDGLFSRFIFYSYMLEPQWRDVSPKEGLNMESEFQLFSEHYYKIHQEFKSNEINFSLQPSQWALLNSSCEEWLITESELTGMDTRSIVMRLGIIRFRISMILTAIRNYERKSISETLICDDVDFQIAVGITEVIMQHALAVFSHLEKKTAEHQSGNVTMETFFNALPDQFQRKEAAEKIAGSISIGIRTADKYLRELTALGSLKVIKYGTYRKVTPAADSG